MAAPAQADALGPDERDLWRRVQELWELTLSPDAAKIRETLHPDYVGWDMSSPSPHRREDAVQSVASAPGRTRAYNLDPLSVRVYDGKTGVVHYRYDATVESGKGRCISVSGAWTEVHVKSGAGWQVVAVSGRPDPASTASEPPARPDRTNRQ